MTNLTPIDPVSVAAQLKERAITLVDIREADEFAREHIEGAVSLPLSRLDKERLDRSSTPVVFHCKSGARTNANCDRLSAFVTGAAFVLDGGLDGWKRAGLPTRTFAGAPLELNRQVQITVGALILAGVLLAVFVNPVFIAIPAFLGTGLVFAGVSGWCGMAHLLATAPWNKRLAS